MIAFIKTCIRAFSAVFATVWFATACTTNADFNEDISFDGAPLAAPTSVAAAIADERIVIRPLDVVEIRIFGVDAFDADYQVDFAGNLRLPLVGSLAAAGQTSFQLAEAIEAELTQDYLQQADVTVRLLESFDVNVTVEGSVKKPGLYPVRGKLSLMQAVALSGGLAEGANPKRVVVFRTIDAERQAAGYNLDLIRKGVDNDPLIYGDDIVVVDGSDLTSSYREFLRSVPLLALFVAL